MKSKTIKSILTALVLIFLASTAGYALYQSALNLPGTKPTGYFPIVAYGTVALVNNANVSAIGFNSTWLSLSIVYQQLANGTLAPTTYRNYFVNLYMPGFYYVRYLCDNGYSAQATSFFATPSAFHQQMYLELNFSVSECAPPQPPSGGNFL